MLPHGRLPLVQAPHAPLPKRKPELPHSAEPTLRPSRVADCDGRHIVREIPNGPGERGRCATTHPNYAIQCRLVRECALPHDLGSRVSARIRCAGARAPRRARILELARRAVRARRRAVDPRQPARSRAVAALALALARAAELALGAAARHTLDGAVPRGGRARRARLPCRERRPAPPERRAPARAAALSPELWSRLRGRSALDPAPARYRGRRLPDAAHGAPARHVLSRRAGRGLARPSRRRGSVLRAGHGVQGVDGDRSPRGAALGARVPLPERSRAPRERAALPRRTRRDLGRAARAAPARTALAERRARPARERARLCAEPARRGRALPPARGLAPSTDPVLRPGRRGRAARDDRVGARRRERAGGGARTLLALAASGLPGGSLLPAARADLELRADRDRVRGGAADVPAARRAGRRSRSRLRRR